LVPDGDTGIHSHVPCDDSVMNPKCDEGDPASVTVHGFEVIVLDHSEAGPCSSEDSEEHGEDDVRHRDVSDVHVVVAIVDKVFGDNGGVENEPYDSCGTGATVCSSIVEDFSQSPTKGDWKRMRDANSDLVAKVDYIFLSHENGDHEIGRSRVSNVWSVGSAVVLQDYCQEDCHICREDKCEYLPVRSPEVDWRELFR